MSTLRRMHNLAGIQRECRDHQSAVATRERVLELTRERHDERHKATLDAMFHLGDALMRASRNPAAERLLRECRDKQRRFWVPGIRIQCATGRWLLFLRLVPLVFALVASVIAGTAATLIAGRIIGAVAAILVLGWMRSGSTFRIRRRQGLPAVW